MHIKVVLYFLHIVLSGMLTGLSLAIACTLYFEEMMTPIPLFLGAFLISTGWFIWRVRIQRRYKFCITKKAFKIFLPLSLICIGALTLGATQLINATMVNPPRIMFLLYLTGGIASLAIIVQILDFENMPRREKIAYRRGGERKDRSDWRRSSGHRVLQG
ncbi:MAG: hypothetical protein AAF212_11465 [Verrucomicrobiota bacterium]